MISLYSSFSDGCRCIVLFSSASWGCRLDRHFTIDYCAETTGNGMQEFVPLSSRETEQK
ncbi:MAG TPA: hypothetical protein PKL48_07640 [Thermodesulfobacteriota bacterium]|nr:hypothetical protein [Thermodesulfobacteriota bacterium]